MTPMVVVENIGHRISCISVSSVLVIVRGRLHVSKRL